MNKFLSTQKQKSTEEPFKIFFLPKWLLLHVIRCESYAVG